MLILIRLTDRWTSSVIQL